MAGATIFSRESVCSRTALVFVDGGEPTTGPRPWDVEQVQLAHALGARALTVNAGTPAATTRQTFRIAETERIPLVLLISYDKAAAPAADEPAAPSTPPRAAVTDETDIAEIARLPAGVSRPLVLAGRGAGGVAAELGEHADRIRALTASSVPARRTFAAREFDLGVCDGFASEDASMLIRQADVVFAVRAGLNQFTTAFVTQFMPMPR